MAAALSEAEAAPAEAEIGADGTEADTSSSDSVEKVAELNKGSEYAYTLLSDSGMEAGKAFGIAFEVDSDKFQKFLNKHSGETHALLPVPAVYVVDEDRKVRFQYVNPDYKTRLPADELLAVAKVIAAAD